MATQCSRELFGSNGVEGRRRFDGGEVTFGRGPLLLGATDWAIGLVGRFAACFDVVRGQRVDCLFARQ